MTAPDGLNRPLIERLVAESGALQRRRAGVHHRLLRGHCRGLPQAGPEQPPHRHPPAAGGGRRRPERPDAGLRRGLRRLRPQGGPDPPHPRRPGVPPALPQRPQHPPHPAPVAGGAHHQRKRHRGHRRTQVRRQRQPGRPHLQPGGRRPAHPPHRHRRPLRSRPPGTPRRPTGAPGGVLRRRARKGRLRPGRRPGPGRHGQQAPGRQKGRGRRPPHHHRQRPDPRHPDQNLCRRRQWAPSSCPRPKN